jgi:hypothetical protein
LPNSCIGTIIADQKSLTPKMSSAMVAMRIQNPEYL